MQFFCDTITVNGGINTGKFKAYSRGPNKSDALNRSDGWKNVKKLIRAMALNKSDAWKIQSLPVQILCRHKYEKNTHKNRIHS